MPENHSFETWMETIIASIESLSQSYTQTGRRNQTLDALSAALRNADPFIRYGALKNATRLMQDPSLYH